MDKEPPEITPQKTGRFEFEPKPPYDLYRLHDLHAEALVKSPSTGKDYFKYPPNTPETSEIYKRLTQEDINGIVDQWRALDLDDETSQRLNDRALGCVVRNLIDSHPEAVISSLLSSFDAETMDKGKIVNWVNKADLFFLAGSDFDRIEELAYQVKVDVNNKSISWGEIDGILEKNYPDAFARKKTDIQLLRMGIISTFALLKSDCLTSPCYQFSGSSRDLPVLRAFFTDPEIIGLTDQKEIEQVKLEIATSMIYLVLKDKAGSLNQDALEYIQKSKDGISVFEFLAMACSDRPAAEIPEAIRQEIELDSMNFPFYKTSVTQAVSLALVRKTAVNPESLLVRKNTIFHEDCADLIKQAIELYEGKWDKIDPFIRKMFESSFRESELINCSDVLKCISPCIAYGYDVPSCVIQALDRIDPSQFAADFQLVKFTHNSELNRWGEVDGYDTSPEFQFLAKGLEVLPAGIREYFERNRKNPAFNQVLGKHILDQLLFRSTFYREFFYRQQQASTKEQMEAMKGKYWQLVHPDIWQFIEAAPAEEIIKIFASNVRIFGKEMTLVYHDTDGQYQETNLPMANFLSPGLKAIVGQRLEKTIAILNSPGLDPRLEEDSMNEIKLLSFALTPEVLDRMNEKDRRFWQYWIGADENLGGFLFKHRTDFGKLVVNGELTDDCLQLLVQENPTCFVDISGKAYWQRVFGQQTISGLLAVLPTISDESRNAFTHNEYDRTSQFMKYLLDNVRDDFSLTGENLEILTSYIKQFGLAKTPVLFHYFKHLLLGGRQTGYQFPMDIEQSGIKTTGELLERYRTVKETVYGEEPLTDLSKFTDFERQLLKTITGKSSHRFDAGRPSMEQITADFQADYAKGLIVPLAPEFGAATTELENIRITFDTEKIRPDFDTLKEEILESIAKKDGVADLKEELTDFLKSKVKDREKRASTAEGKQKEAILTDAGKLTALLGPLEKVDTLDSLLVYLVDTNFGRIDKQLAKSTIRRLVLRKAFARHFSPEYINDLENQLHEPITAQSLLSVVNVLDNLVKAHVLNIKTENSEGYWSAEAFGKLKKEESFAVSAFSPHAGNLRQAVEDFEEIKTGGKTKIRIIPDRGLIGEMSGYLADVCYTKEYPLLKNRPNLNPYKFIEEKQSADPEAPELEFIGSVLTFEIDDKAGNRSILVRGFDVPNEGQIHISKFIETFLDRLAQVARKRGVKQILIPGFPHAISNYQMTIQHMTQSYITGKEPVSLKKKFDFNQYDITDNCYVARKC